MIGFGEIDRNFLALLSTLKVCGKSNTAIDCDVPIISHEVRDE